MTFINLQKAILEIESRILMRSILKDEKAKVLTRGNKYICSGDVDWHEDVGFLRDQLVPMEFSLL